MEYTFKKISSIQGILDETPNIYFDENIKRYIELSTY